MKLFFDTNVLLDHALMRSTGQPLEITHIIFWAQNNHISIKVSPGSLYSFTYVLHKHGIRGTAFKHKLSQYLSLLDICVAGKEIFINGINSSFKDLEDSFQYMNAITAHCDYLITSNIADFQPFAEDIIRVMSPAQFLTDVLGRKRGVDY